MSSISQKRITRSEFLRLFGLSSVSLLASGSLADEILAGVHSDTIPVKTLIRPNAFPSAHITPFSSIVTLPEGYKAADVDLSSVRCEGIHASGSILHPDGRTIAILYDESSLRNDLCGFPTQFTVTGQLADGSGFEGTDAVALIEADRCVVYHTSSRRRRSCGACKSHAANRIYFSGQVAEADRAHPGCNCRVVEEQIGWEDYMKAFWPDSRGEKAVYDKRWGWPPPSPAGLHLEYPPALEEHLRRG